MTTTDLYAVLGNPVEHSKSPRIHTLFARQCHQALRYERRLIALGGFDAGLAAFRAAGGCGCNVTVPFKFDAAHLARRLSPRAALAGAANTLGWDVDGTLWADNTDGIGLVRDLARLMGKPVHGLLRELPVLLLGAGGAAAGVLGALIEAGPPEIAIWNRTAERARALVARMGGFARSHDCTLRCSELAPGERYPLIINATASSLGGHAIALPPGLLGPGVLAYDLMYAPAPTPFVAQARALGAQAADGMGMLVEQAAESFRLWRGMLPDTEPVLAALETELRAAPSGQD